jgi:hypothetical protein
MAWDKVLTCMSHSRQRGRGDLAMVLFPDGADLPSEVSLTYPLSCLQELYSVINNLGNIDHESLILCGVFNVLFQSILRRVG